MPVPTPREDENQDEFIARCMANDTMNEEYPEEDQRAAICFQSWRDRNKENDKEMEKIIKIFDSFEVKETKDDRTLEFVGSKEITDRDKEIVKVAGLDLKNYKKNPVVLWSHQYDQPPVAKATKVWKSKDEVKFNVKFADMEEYSFADTIYKLYKGGYMNAVSIGFIPDYDSIEYPEKSKGGTQRIFNKSELIELSLVPVGANPAALLQSKGIQKALDDKAIDNTELEEMKLMLEELIEKTLCPDCGQEEDKCICQKEVTEEDIELKRLELGYGQIYCSKCQEEINKIEENTEDSINKDDGDNYIDELLSVLRAKKAQEKEQEEQEINELIQILKEGKEQDG